MNDIIKMEDGFYYYWEDDFQGPFPSLQCAQVALDALEKWAEQDNHKIIKKMKDNMGV